MNSAQEQATRVHALGGLEPDNLLAFLTLLGTLKALEVIQPALLPRAFWTGKPPVVMLKGSFETTRFEVVEMVEEGLRKVASVYAFDGDDLNFTIDEFRAYAQAESADLERASLVAALGSDGAPKRDGERVQPTPLCAMFGQGHQHFLARLAAVTARDDPANLDDLDRALFEAWAYADDTESFRWDPIEDRRYAHQFGSPSESRNKIGTVSGANRLAAIGFCAFTCAPTVSGLATLGVAIRNKERAICWPIVGKPTSYAGHRALLGHPALLDEVKASSLSGYGLIGIARSRRIQVEKYFNFERARIQVLA